MVEWVQLVPQIAVALPIVGVGVLFGREVRRARNGVHRFATRQDVVDLSDQVKHNSSAIAKLRDGQEQILSAITDPKS